MQLKNNYNTLKITRTEQIEHKKFLSAEKRKDKKTVKKSPEKCILV